MTDNAAGLRVAVTGAGGGLGSAICSELRSRNAVVIEIDITAEHLGEPGYAVDVTDPEAVEALFEEIGPLDGLVLAHGITTLGSATEVPAAAVIQVIAVNLTGAITCATAALQGLIERSGRIVVLTSVAGFAPLVNRTAYAASKHGLHGFFDSLRAETRGTGLSITLAAPSFVRTGIEERAAYRSSGDDGSWSTTGKVLSPDQVAVIITDGMLARKRLLLPTPTAKQAWLVSRLAPRIYERLMVRRILGSD